jgi:hypothetical protein
MIYRTALHCNWNALSLARRALKDKFPTPTVHSHLCCQNVRYFCRTLQLLNFVLSWYVAQVISGWFGNGSGPPIIIIVLSLCVVIFIWDTWLSVIWINYRAAPLRDRLNILSFTPFSTLKCFGILKNGIPKHGTTRMRVHVRRPYRLRTLFSRVYVTWNTGDGVECSQQLSDLLLNHHTKRRRPWSYFG